MKRTIVIILVIVATASMLIAAGNRPVLPLKGTLQWTRASVCGVSDFVSLPIMQNVYLTGNFKPTKGVIQGCSINAMGSPYMLEGCHYFAVSTYTISCADIKPGGHR